MFSRMNRYGSISGLEVESVIGVLVRTWPGRVVYRSARGLGSYDQRATEPARTKNRSM